MRATANTFKTIKYASFIVWLVLFAWTSWIICTIYKIKIQTNEQARRQLDRRNQWTQSNISTDNYLAPNYNSTQVPKYYKDDVHIFFSSDESNRIGLYVVMNSIIINHKTSKRIYFHILVEYNVTMYRNDLNRYFNKYTQNNKMVFELKEFSLYTQYYNVYSKYVVTHEEGNTHIFGAMNFARFYFTNVFDLDLKHIRKAIYLDVDTIVQTDIQILYDYIVNNSVPIRFISNKNYSLDHYNIFTKKLRQNETHKQLLNISETLINNRTAYNAGIYLYDIYYWIQNNFTQKYEYYLRLNYENGGALWKLGTQPILNLLYVHCNIATISDERWHVSNLGYKSGINQSKLNNGYILHWNGGYKPWTEKAIKHYKQIWSNYIPKESVQTLNG